MTKETTSASPLTSTPTNEPPLPPPQPPASLLRLLEQIEDAAGGGPDLEARAALSKLGEVLAEGERRRTRTVATTSTMTATAVDDDEEEEAPTTTAAAAATAAAEAAEAQEARAAAAAEDLALRLSALESRVEALNPETAAIVAEALAETIEEGGEGEDD